MIMLATLLIAGACITAGVILLVLAKKLANKRGVRLGRQYHVYTRQGEGRNPYGGKNRVIEVGVRRRGWLGKNSHSKIGHVAADRLVAYPQDLTNLQEQAKAVAATLNINKDTNE